MYSGIRWRRFDVAYTMTLSDCAATEPSRMVLSALYPGSPSSKDRSSQKTMKRSGRSATRATMSGRSTRSSLSTSIRRRPCGWYSLRQALMSDDLPVPSEPVSSTLLAGRPSTNWRVLRSTAAFCSSMLWRSSRRMGESVRTGSRMPSDPNTWRLRRQRNATAPFQSGGPGGAGNSASTRSTRAWARTSSSARAFSGAVVGIDRNVVVREVAGPDGGGESAASERDPDGDLGLLHDAPAVGFAVVRMDAAGRGDVDIVEPHVHAVDVEVLDAGIADGTQQAAEVRVGREEGGLDQG